ncbi:hypothetical protein WOLCODRAFT_139428 [Wolfiporia cocos MD-104 SS10]|uniref:Uncharacterized protein n=1 Tax=Wolfiporia cocos (strain MD-104) TaxID=742152 RepID=A0A2H3IX65_WOLCO|nr:hypothetical protein WOLCODRAFT_139428 [Wolfiporia cocos MD-104 SS10]
MLSILPLVTAVLWVFAHVPQAQAYPCGYNEFEECTGLSPGARIGIGIAIAVVGLLLMIMVGVMRQRRIRRQNLAYVNNQAYPMQGGAYGVPPNRMSAYSPVYVPQQPQYPAPTHGYDPSSGFAPPYQPYQPQPPKYTPPEGPPPFVSDKTRPF